MKCRLLSVSTPPPQITHGPINCKNYGKWGDSVALEIKNKKQNKLIVSEKLYIRSADTINYFRSSLACCEDSYRRNPMGHEFFVPARTLIGKAVNPCLWSQIICDHLNYLLRDRLQLNPY